MNMVLKLIVRVWSALFLRFSQVFGRFLLYLNGVGGASKIVFYGLPVISVWPKSEVYFGPRLVLCSHPRYTALGVSRPVVIRTLSECAKIHIGADVGISGGVICAAERIEIGDQCLFGADVQVTDTDFHPLAAMNRRFENSMEKIGSAPVFIGRNVFLGAGVRVLKGVRIGENSVIGAGSVVASDIPANVIAAGVPAKVIRPIPL